MIRVVLHSCDVHIGHRIWVVNLCTQGMNWIRPKLKPAGPCLSWLRTSNWVVYSLREWGRCRCWWRRCGELLSPQIAPFNDPDWIGKYRQKYRKKYKRKRDPIVLIMIRKMDMIGMEIIIITMITFSIHIDEESIQANKLGMTTNKFPPPPIKEGFVTTA